MMVALQKGFLKRFQGNGNPKYSDLRFQDLYVSMFCCETSTVLINNR